MEVQFSDPFFLTLSPTQKEELTKEPWQKVTRGSIPSGSIFVVNEGVCRINETGGSIYPGVLSGSLPFLKQPSFNFSVEEGSAFCLSGARLATFLRTHPMLYFQYLNDAKNKGRRAIESEQSQYPKIALLCDQDTLDKTGLQSLLKNLSEKSIVIDITQKGTNLFEKLKVPAPDPALLNEESEHAESARRSIERGTTTFLENGPELMNLQFLSPYACNSLEWAILLHELKEKYDQVLLYSDEVEEQWSNSAQIVLLSKNLVNKMNELSHSGYWSYFENLDQANELLSTFWNFSSVGLHESMNEVPEEELDVQQIPLLFPSAIADYHLPDTRAMYRYIQPVYPRRYFFKKKKNSEIKAKLNFFLPYKQNNRLKIRYILSGQSFPVTSLYLPSFLKLEKDLLFGCDGADVNSIVQQFYGLHNVNIRIYSENSKSNFPGILTRNFSLESYKYGKVFQKR